MKWTPLLLGLCLVASSTALALESYQTFWDVPEDAWYADSVNHLAELNILQGYSDAGYHPADNVNRAELAVILDRLLEYTETGTVTVDKPDDALKLDVTFTSQAPTSDWSMPYQEACEEASLIMVAYYWMQDDLTAQAADTEIQTMVAWEAENGYGVDVSAAEIAQIASDFYGLNAEVYYDEEVTIESIKEALSGGYPVIIPAAGQVLANPNYTGYGPPYHMVVIVGFDESGFIVHDPGTTFGESYSYSYETIDAAIHDWTGSKSTVEAEGRKAMIVVSVER